MKTILLAGLIFSSAAFAEVYELAKGSGSYEVKVLVKKVTGESTALKGKMACPATECEFLVAVPVKTFVSSDGNRDSNMIETIEAAKFPVATGKGKFQKENLAKSSWLLPLEVEFHGVKKMYEAKMQKLGDGIAADFTLKLEDHRVERPSLFGVAVENTVPMRFQLTWKKKD